MSDVQNLPGTGIRGEHRVYSDFFSDNNIIQQTAIVAPKSILIDGLRSVFKNDNIFTYRSDEYGYPLTVDLTGGDIDSEDTTKILISDAYRYDVKFFPAIIIKSSGGSYKPLSFNQNMTYKYRRETVTDEYGATRVISTPTHRVYSGLWDMNFEVGIYSESYSELEELVDIVSIALQYTLWNDLRENGLFIKRLNIGAESAEPYANDYIYNQNITINTHSEWRVEIPLDNVIEKLVFYFDSVMHPIPGQKDEADILSLNYNDILQLSEI